VVWASADHLPFADKQFDLVTSGDLLEHIPEADVPAVIAELKRVGKRQFHDIYCGANPDDRDATHITIHPISWWQNLFGKEAILRETKP
jgi:ubiquinone/menaquinone biosynthesis C-methylase UbiE